MNPDEKFSAETINAFVDNQLSLDEKEHIYLEMEHDSELAHYICRLRTAHELIHDAYDPALLPPIRQTFRKRSQLERICRAAVVVLLFIAGAFVGWIGHAQLAPATTLSADAAASNTSTQPGQNVLLHVSSGDPARINMALNNAEQMLKRAYREGRNLHLEILANEEGINLYNSDIHSFAMRVAKLKHDYSNVSFLACAKTLQRLKEKGIHYDMLPQTQLVPSALDEIVNRMESGWVYIHV